MKRVLGVLLALIMVLTVIPATAVTASAAGLSGMVNDTVSWTFAGGTLTMSGVGDVDSPWNQWADPLPDVYRTSVRRIVAEEGITGLFWYVFQNLTASHRLYRVVHPRQRGEYLHPPVRCRGQAEPETV